jgi:hypothetical protein
VSDDPVQAAYEAGEREGYRRGEDVRRALRLSNDDLRQQVKALVQMLDAYAGAGR